MGLYTYPHLNIYSRQGMVVNSKASITRKFKEKKGKNPPKEYLFRLSSVLQGANIALDPMGF